MVKMFLGLGYCDFTNAVDLVNATKIKIKIMLKIDQIYDEHGHGKKNNVFGTKYHTYYYYLKNCIHLVNTIKKKKILLK